MPKFTPGPWKADALNEDRFAYYILPAINAAGQWGPWIADIMGHINDTFPSEEQARANAHLIAAAPEMYEALKEAEILYARYGLLAQESTCGPWINKVRSALAKADGKVEL